MLLVMMLIFAMTAWQFQFLYDGVMANVYMNGAIIAAFLFACMFAFYNIHKLKREVVALYALREMWDDVRLGPKNAQTDPYWRHYRALKPGIVFEAPKILGHAFDLVVDEIGRTKTLRLGVETMTTLVHKIDQKLADERSFLGYMSGLLVFMGLIGAFIGLLKMVGSIGGIIGGLEGAAAGGGDGFGKLLSDLQKTARRHGHRLRLLAVRPVRLAGRRPARPVLQRRGDRHQARVRELAGLGRPARRQLGNHHGESAGHGGGAGGSVGSREGKAIAQQIAVSLDPLISRSIAALVNKQQAALDRTTDAIRALAEKQGEQAEAVRSTADKLASWWPTRPKCSSTSPA